METAMKEEVGSNVAQKSRASVTVPTKALVKVTFDSKDRASLTAADGAAVKLSTIVQERKLWETGAYRTSNQQLYGILTQCYALYHAMGQSNDSAKVRRAELKRFCEKNKIKCKADTHGIVKIVKCVFFDDAQSVDRRRISTYSLALRCALDKKVAVADLASFIEKHGGVQELRRSKAKKSPSLADRAEHARLAIATAVPMTSLRNDAVSQSIDATEYDQPFVAIVVKRADGQIEIHGVVKSKAAVNAALVTLYPQADSSSTSKAIK